MACCVAFGLRGGEISTRGDIGGARSLEFISHALKLLSMLSVRDCDLLRKNDLRLVVRAKSAGLLHKLFPG